MSVQMCHLTVNQETRLIGERIIEVLLYVYIYKTIGNPWLLTQINVHQTYAEKLSIIV